MGFPWGSLVSGGLQLAGAFAPKLFGGGKHNMIKSIVGDAQKAGIHPIYALGAGIGNSGYAGPEISWGDAAGAGMSALSNVADVWDRENQAGERDRAASAAAEADRRFQAQQALMDRQLQAELNKPRPLTPMDQAQLELVRAQTRTELMRAKMMALGGAGGGNVSDVNVPVRLPFGAAWDTKTGGMSPSQTVQNEYGDIAENVYGLSKLGVDAGVNIYDWLQRMGRIWGGQGGRPSHLRRPFAGQ